MSLIRSSNVTVVLVPTGMWVLVLCSLVFVAGCLQTTSPLPADWVRGTNFFAFDGTDLAAPETLAEVAALPTTVPGIDMVAVQWMWQQSNVTSDDIAVYRSTPNTQSLVAFAEAAHAAGLKVFFKPVVVAQDGAIMPQLNPSNVSAWFESYTSLLLGAAALAQDLAVARFSIGVELQIIATDADNLGRWASLIQAVRRLYNGTLTYGSNPLTGETPLVPFWVLLDDVGVDVYVPLVSSQLPNASLTPTWTEMKATYQTILQWKVIDWYANSSAARAGKKLFVCESGYPSSNKGLQQPWQLPPHHVGCTGDFTGNQTAQADAFAVQFEVLSTPPYASMFAGFVQFWYGQPGTSDYIGTPGSLWPCGWTPANKTALDVLRAAFSRQ